MSDAPRCPFDDPAFTMDPHAPCPVCGALETLTDEDDLPSRCVAFRRGEWPEAAPHD